MSIEEAMRQLGINDAAYYKWRRECGGLRVDQAKRLKELEAENSRLRLFLFPQQREFPFYRLPLDLNEVNVNPGRSHIIVVLFTIPLEYLFSEKCR